MINEMTGKERVLAALAGKEFDMYPAISFTSVATVEQMKMVKAFYPYAHTDASKMAGLAATGHTILGFDTIAPYFSILLEAAALGAKVEWGNEFVSPFVAEAPLKDLAEISLPSNLTKKSEIYELLKAIRILKKKYGDKVAIVGKVMGPWTLASHLYGVEKLVLDSILEPEKVKTAIENLSAVPITFAKEQFDAGIDILVWADHATSDLVSAEMYKEFVYPVQRKACMELKGRGPVVLHVCGRVEDRFSLFIDAGFSCFHLDSRNDIVNLVNQGRGKIQFAGGINNPITLMRGSVSKIDKEAAYNIEHGVTMIGPECAIQTTVPMKNLVALVNATHNYKAKKRMR